MRGSGVLTFLRGLRGIFVKAVYSFAYPPARTAMQFRSGKISPQNDESLMTQKRMDQHFAMCNLPYVEYVVQASIGKLMMGGPNDA